MTQNRSVSIVMATYNGERFLYSQLMSLAGQTIHPCELLISDDGSSDNTVAIAEAFAREAPFPVRVIRNPERLGYGENFISTAKQAQGGYVAFCDQDDIWLPEKIELALDSLESKEADLFVHAASVINSQGVEVGRFDQGISKRTIIEPLRLAPWGVFYGFSMVFRRDCLDVIDPGQRGAHTFEWQGELSHDLWIYFVATSLGTVIVDPRALVRYRRHEANETPSLTGEWLRMLSQRLGAAAHPRLRRDLIAQHRSMLMLSYDRSEKVSRFKGRAKRASLYWDRIARIEELRLQAYGRESIARRAAACARLISEGGYRSHKRGGLGWPLLVKDLVLGVYRLKRRMASVASI